MASEPLLRVQAAYGPIGRMLRTQVAPMVLIGDSILDRPEAAEMPQGTLFHESTTGLCLVLVINDITGERRWEQFCGGTGATGAIT